jgi:Domain of unknown function (DUF4157)
MIDRSRRSGGVGAEVDVVRRAGVPGKQTLTEGLPARANDAASDAVEQKGSGAPVASEVMQAVEPALGMDLGGVRVHTDAGAASAAETMGARAFAHQSDIFLAAGESPGDVRLMAHELTHVAQQGGGVHPKLAIGALDAPEEREADAVADAVASGRAAAAPTITSAPSVRRAPAKDHAEAAAAADQALPSWSEKEIKAIQRQLHRLGLYVLHIDGDLGPGSQAGLVEAFGSDEWRTMSFDACLARLHDAEPPPGKKGQHELRWGEMFKDGVLDMTVGLGFDETGFNVAALQNLQDALSTHGFANDPAVAAEVYKQAGRAAGGIGDFYVKKDALSYTPPAGSARSIHAVVRLIYSLDGSKGKEVAEAFKDGMVGSDVAYYTGHGRYGSGPDFDRNFTIDLLNDDGSVDVTYDEYSDAEKALAKEGHKHGRGAWKQFLWRVEHKTIRVNGSNDGNVVLNTDNPHGNEFGGNLMYWNLTKNGGGAPKVTGKEGALGKAAEAAPDRKYRVMVFDGCRSVDYEKQLRKTKGYDKKSADMFGSSVELNWGDEGKTLATFLDSIVKMQSAEQIAKNMDKQQSVGPGAYHAYGVDDNPVHK